MNRIFAVVFIVLFQTGAYALPSESQLAEKIASDINQKISGTQKNKIGVFPFLNLKSQETPEGKRLGDKIMMELQKNPGYMIVDRSQMGDLLKEQGLSQSGAIDPEYSIEAGKILPVQVMVKGTVVSYGEYGELTIKVMDSETGQIYYVRTEKYIPQEKFTYEDSDSDRQSHSENRENWDAAERTYFALESLSGRRPRVFLVLVLERSEFRKLRRTHPGLIRQLRQSAEAMKKDEGSVRAKRQRIKKGLEIMQKTRPDLYEKTMQRKREIIAGLPKGENN